MLLLKGICDSLVMTGPVRTERIFFLVNNIHKYSNFYVDIRYLSQTTSLKTLKLENKLFYRYTSGKGWLLP